MNFMKLVDFIKLGFFLRRELLSYINERILRRGIILIKWLTVLHGFEI